MNEYSVTDTWGDVHNVEPAIRTDDGSRVVYLDSDPYTAEQALKLARLLQEAARSLMPRLLDVSDDQ